MASIKLSVALISLCLSVVQAARALSNSPVCIVGAGPAGLAAASRLESNGQSTVLFDKQSSVGGKCQEYYDTDTDTYHPLGALLFTNGTYKNAVEIINEVAVPATLFTAGIPVYEYNITNGTVFPFPALTLEFEALVAEEFARYELYWNTVFALDDSIGYKNGVPEDFTLTTSEWLAKYDYSALPAVFVQAMVAYGYGDPAQTPILYILQYLAPDVLSAFIGIGPGYVIDFHEVFSRFAKSYIKGPINLNVNITRIDRSGSSPIITYTAANSTGSTTQNCSSLILAFPPDLPALQAANLDVTEEETTVFSPIGTTNYYAGAVSLNNTARQKLYEAASPSPALPPPASGEPVAFLQLWNSSAIATTWSWDAYRQPSNISKARALLKSTLSKVNKDPTNPNAVPTPITDDNVKAFIKADYFPHYDSAQLAAGYYNLFDQLQGQKQTYFASGLNAFETVEFALRAGYDVVDSYILKNM